MATPRPILDPFQSIVNVGWSTGDALTIEYRATGTSDDGIDLTATATFPQVDSGALDFNTSHNLTQPIKVNRVFIGHTTSSGGTERTYSYVTNRVAIHQSWTIRIGGDDIPVSSNSTEDVQVQTYDDTGAKGWVILGATSAPFGGDGDLSDAIAAIIAQATADSSGLDNYAITVDPGSVIDSGTGSTTPPGTRTDTNNGTTVFDFTGARLLLPDPKPSTMSIEIEVPDPGGDSFSWSLRCATWKGKKIPAFPVDSHALPTGWPVSPLPTSSATESGSGERTVTFTIDLSTLGVTSHGE